MSTPRRDPRPYQIAVLGSLLLGGLATGRLDIPWWQPCVTGTAALLTQYIGTRWVGLPRFDPRSALITALGLTLLLRTASPMAAALAPTVGLGAKFLVRYRGKHLFNPAMLGLITTVTLTGEAWISPGQWGHDLLLAGCVAIAGLWVVHSAVRSDLTVTFLVGWCAATFGRALYLGDPLTIPLHHLHNGSLVVFAFFMISDPKTAPDARPARIVHALLIAGLAAYIELGLYQESGPVRALFLLSPLVIVWDRLMPADRYTWTSVPTRSTHAPVHPDARPDHHAHAA